VDSGKSVIVIEHHQAVMATPTGSSTLARRGHDGGRVVFEGALTDFVAARSTLTGEHLAAFVEADRRPSQSAETRRTRRA
jgi:excinuclease UvrABC ATPase subunit